MPDVPITLCSLCPLWLICSLWLKVFLSVLCGQKLFQCNATPYHTKYVATPLNNTIHHNTISTRIHRFQF